MIDDYLTTNEVAAVLRTSPETVRYWRHIGYGPESVKTGRRVLYPRSALAVWMEGLRRDQKAARGA